MSVLTPGFLSRYDLRDIPWGNGGMGEMVYRRTYSRQIDSGSESWIDTNLRCLQGSRDIDSGLTEDEEKALFDFTFNLQGSFSGRALWQLGTSNVERFGGSSLCNCYFLNINALEDFESLMSYLMLGGGVGFSVERAKIHDLPPVKLNVDIIYKPTNDADIIVADSREGWVRLLHSTLKSFLYTGKSFSYSDILIRPQGSPLRNFGGTASGPAALREGITNISKVMQNRAGKKLRSVDVLDVCNIIGRIVMAGSSRRSAQIALGDPDDFLFIRAKNWASGKIPAWRSQSNNTILADSYEEIVDEVWKGYNGSGEAYGFFNRKLARTEGRLGEFIDDGGIEGGNPCLELGLESAESCNLSTLFLPNIKNLQDALLLSRCLYKVQKAITSLDYVDPRTTEIVHRNRRLGLSVAGFLQASKEQVSWLPEIYSYLREFDKSWSKQRGLSESIKLTTVQPGGTLPLLAGVLPGVSPGYDEFIIRRVRMASHDPLVDYCKAKGYNVVTEIGLDGKENHDQQVVEFPVETPKNSILSKNISAVEQLKWIKLAQTNWSDNAVSSTVYFKPNELPEVKQYLQENYEDTIKSVSFLLHTEHGFILPPLESITESEFKKRNSKIKSDVVLGDVGNEILDVGDCVGGACPIR